jgi:hypothetical protein
MIVLVCSIYFFLQLEYNRKKEDEGVGLLRSARAPFFVHTRKEKEMMKEISTSNGWQMYHTRNSTDFLPQVFTITNHMDALSYYVIIVLLACFPTKTHFYKK